MRTSKVADETVVLFSDARSQLGIEMHTIRSWTRRGILGADGVRVYLDWCKIGGKPATSKEAVRRFFRETNGG